MSLPPTPADQTDPPSPSGEEDLAVDLAAFLPEGVELAPAEAGSGTVDLEALTQLEHELDEVDAAIARLDDGTYGLDPVTGVPIDDALLAEDPTRRS